VTSEPLGIGLLGYGTVGSAVDRLLRERADVVERVAGRPVRVVRALVRDPSRARDGAAPALLTARFEDIRDDPSITVVAEVMGGVEPTLGYLRELLERGVSVVSANKQLLARHGAELQQAAERGGAQLRYEASACAAIPVVRVLQESLAAAGVDELIGIVNGTTNFMLSAMAREGRSYADALAEAQALGYAEADPSEDVGGADAAAKLAILASLAFHRHLHIDDVPFEGIDTLHDDDVAFASELGYAVKLLAHARVSEDGIAARVAPVLVPHDHPLAQVSGSFNAVMLRGREIREITLQGPGAGGAETATAVIGDLLSVLGPRPAGEVGTAFRELPLEPPGRARSRLYVHLEVTDRPGVLARIAARFGDRGISLGAMIQRPRPGDISSLVFLTHPASEENARSAVDEIATLDFCHGQPRVLRVLAA
jgi:homoserine dehydrogenase